MGHFTTVLFLCSAVFCLMVGCEHGPILPAIQLKTENDSEGNRNSTGSNQFSSVRWEANNYFSTCTSYAPDDFMPLNLTYPLPGASFTVGDTVVLGICYEPDEPGLGGESIWLVSPEGAELLIVSLAKDDLTADQLEGISEGRFAWVIPDSIPFEEGMESIRGDSLCLELKTYVGMFPSSETYGPYSISAQEPGTGTIR